MAQTLLHADNPATAHLKRHLYDLEERLKMLAKIDPDNELFPLMVMKWEQGKRFLKWK